MGGDISVAGPFLVAPSRDKICFQE